MAVYNISYDLHKPIQGYDELIKAIKKIGDFRHPLLSMWFVATASHTSKTIYEALKPYLDSDDRIYIQKTSSDFWGALPGVNPKEFWEWLSANL